MTAAAGAREAAAPLSAAAPAKLNLYLHLLGRRADGYHLLDSLIGFAEVHDRLAASMADDLSLDVVGPFATALPGGADQRAPGGDAENLVLRAARALAAAAGVAPRARLVLDKRLPVAAGIGGGSADAAAALRLLAALWGVGPAAADLRDLATELGADVPVCLYGRPAFVGGIGEEIEAAPPLPDAALVLANPGRAVATADVFAGAGPPAGRAARFHQAVPTTEALAELLGARRNDLAPAATGLIPEIEAALAALAAAPGCLLARMSGSGATCFGLFAEAGAARRGAAAIAAERPGWWLAATRLVADCRELDTRI